MARSRKDRSTKIEGSHDEKPKREPYKRLKYKTKDWLNVKEDADEDDLELLLHMDD